MRQAHRKSRPNHGAPNFFVNKKRFLIFWRDGLPRDFLCACHLRWLPECEAAGIFITTSTKCRCQNRTKAHMKCLHTQEQYGRAVLISRTCICEPVRCQTGSHSELHPSLGSAYNSSENVDPLPTYQLSPYNLQRSRHIRRGQTPFQLRTPGVYLHAGWYVPFCRGTATT